MQRLGGASLIPAASASFVRSRISLSVCRTYSTRRVDERQLLEKLLTDPTSEYPPYFVSQVRKLRQLEAHKPASKSASIRHPFSPKRPSADPELEQLLNQPTLSTRELDAYTTKRLKSATPFEARERLHEILIEMATASSANSLRWIMQYLAKYWQSGILGVRPLIREAREQADAVLVRALEAHHPTEYKRWQKQVVE